ncbi:MAG: hypothetical protein ACW99Q_12520 [Candidatus Kariarchaeaceae archaeon]
MKHRQSDIPLTIALVANKVDLRSEEDAGTISTTQGLEYAESLANWSKMKVPYIQTSAKTGLNVDQMFESLIENMILLNTLI